MWAFVAFDLPTHNAKHKRDYQRFRNFLLDSGFMMFQYSVYMRPAGSREDLAKHIERVRRNLPPAGRVSVFEFTDKQFGMAKHFYGKEEALKPDRNQQLEMF